MIYIDISKDFLNLLLANRDISNYRIERGEIENEMGIDECIKFLDLVHTIYYYDENNIFPFAIYKTDKAEYLFYTGNDTSDKDKLFNVLESINYNLSNLTLKDKKEVVLEKLYEAPRFIINSQIYV